LRRGAEGQAAAGVGLGGGGLSEGEQLTEVDRFTRHLLGVGALDAQEQGLGALGVGVGAVA
jgi:hypothetical protein